MKDFEEVDRLSRLTKESDPIADDVTHDVSYNVSPMDTSDSTIMACDPRRIWTSWS